MPGEALGIIGSTTGAISVNTDTSGTANTVMKRDSSGNAEAATLAANTLLKALGGANLKQTTKTSTFTPSVTESVVYWIDSSGGAVTVNLPAVSGAANYFFIFMIKTAGNNVVLDGNSSETVNGATTKTSSTQYNAAIVTCDGSQWVAALIGTWT